MKEGIGGFQPEELLTPEGVNDDSLDGAALLFAAIHDLATGHITRRQASDVARVAAVEVTKHMAQ